MRIVFPQFKGREQTYVSRCIDLLKTTVKYLHGMALCRGIKYKLNADNAESVLWKS